MKISIITPTFNSANFIANNVKSVLKQDYQNFEHIIIDNLSADQTLEIITDLYSEAGKLDKLNIISERDRGISDAFNKGIANSAGDIINILNSDDEYIPQNLLSTVSKLFEDSPETSFVHGDISFIDEKFGSTVRKPLLCKPENAMPFNHPTMFVRRDVYMQAGTFDIGNKYCMDYDLIARWYKEYPGIYRNAFYWKKSPMIKMSAGGISWSHELKMLEEMLNVVTKYGLDAKIARLQLSRRRQRVKIKGIFDKIGLNGLIKLWRKYKWEK